VAGYRPVRQAITRWRRRSDKEGTILPLSELLAREELAGVRVIEAELEHEHGRAVYELELLHDNGRVYERYYDATTGEPLGD
jgi:uncharacterized membrane protein YkoI